MTSDCRSSFVFLTLFAVCMVVYPVHARETDPGASLDEAWAVFANGLQEAQRSLVDPQYFPPPPSERNLAEGYRYMLGHMERMIQLEMRQHPRFPEFHRSMDMLRKWTGENPDAMYLKARIDATGYYRISGRAADTREWTIPGQLVEGIKAPRLVTFQSITDVPGASGELAEMAQCKSLTLDHFNSLQMQIDADGKFEILVGPQKPADYHGNFLLSRKRMLCPGADSEAEYEAQWLSIREIFSDWEREQPLDMDIVRIDALGESRPPITAQEMAAALSRIGTELPNQIRFWSRLQEVALELRSDVNGDGRRAMPVNGINPVEPPFTAGGVAGAQQLYAGGKFELANDEALVIKLITPVEPHYIGFQLNNLWFEGPDQQNYVSSLSGYQLQPASDGARYYVVAHEDPGVPGWVATTGLPEGSHAMRFVFRENPTAAELPRLETFHVKLEQVRDVLPTDTPRIAAGQRREQIAVRQRHIKQRWRNY
jgi:hypothetical protein